MTTQEKMTDLHSRSAEVLRQMGAYSAEMLALSIERLQEIMQEKGLKTLPRSRTLVLTLDAYDSPITNEKKLDALRSNWPDLVISETIFDRQSNKFFIYTQ